MKKIVLSIIALCATTISNAQSYPPPAGQEGTTAISKDDAIIVAWATGAEVTRGLQNIANPDLGYAAVGAAENAIGVHDDRIVSLGDRGEATLTFEQPITNGEGYDFAVFENGFSDTFLELAFVEVSSDGVNFFRFPAISEIQTETQIGGFGAVDCRYINNFAGKYKAGFGTPFDLSEVPDDALLDKNNITHVKIIDVVGSIDPAYASYDSLGNAVNDPYPTPFASSGFDLEGIGVINQQTLGLNNFNAVVFSLYPNPASGVVFIKSNQQAAITVYDVSGRIVKNLPKENYNKITVSDLTSGIYIFEVTMNNERIVKQVVIN